MMSARPAASALLAWIPRRTAFTNRSRGGQRGPAQVFAALLGCLVLSCVLGAAQAAGSVDDELARLEPLAVRQPVEATRQLEALLSGRTGLSEHEQLHAEVIRLVIADAQTRPHDVLAISARIHDRLQVLADPRLQMLAARTQFGAYYELGRADESWVALEEELLQAKRTKDDDLYARALVDRAGYLIKQSDYEPAAAAIADAERRVKSPQESAEVAYANGLLARAVGDWALALNAFQVALEKFTAVGDRTGQADARARGGEALQELGRPAEAIGLLNTAAHDYREVDDRVGEASVMRFLALVHADLNDPDLALRLNAQAIDAISRLDEPVQLARARLERAALLVMRRRAAEAQHLVDAAYPVVFDQDDLTLVALYYQTAAETHAMLGRYHDAYVEMAQYQNTHRRQTDQLVAHQLAAQRGRLESERLSRENALLRAQAASSQDALAEANRAAQLQDLALGLGALVVLGALIAIWLQRRLMRRIARMAETDALTGMLNRRHVLEMGQRMMQRCRRDGRPCAMLMLDVDRFKEINDRYGHLAGDKALRAIAQALGSCLRPGDQIGRYGGEEFAMILPGADAQEAGVVAERLRAAVAQLKPDWAAGAEPLTVSGGIAISTGDLDDFNELIVRADRALYRAKDAGRNRMEYHEPETGPALAPA
jgi:diguanylate cyclase (GGDEF)-like protein